MNQTCDLVPSTTPPDWFVATAQAARHASGCVSNVDVELRRALELDRLDPRLRAELRTVLYALTVLKRSLSFLDMTASEVLKEIQPSSP